MDSPRNLGVLDETDADRPSVVIPNYLISQTNCVSSSDFYSVCCQDECEGLMLRLETSTAQLNVPPALIALAVSGFAADTVMRLRSLCTVLLSRLDAIALVCSDARPYLSELLDVRST